MDQKHLGNILIDEGCINTQQLQACQKEIQETGQSLQECLIDNKYV